jgi:hypothetical protein
MQTHSIWVARRLRDGRTCLSTLLALASVAGGSQAAWAAPKTDVVVLVNGDHITGEIKNLEHNRLKVSTDHMGTVYVEWDKIRSVQSNQYLLLERTDGSRYYGQWAAGGSGLELEVRRDPGSRPESVPMSSVVRAEPIEGGKLLNRLDGYVSAGFDYAKASDRGSLDLAGGLSSRTRIRQWTLDGTMNLTDDGSDEDSTDERWDLSGVWRRFLPNRYFWEGFGRLQRNTELDLNLRTLAGGGVGRYLVQTNRADWVVGTGLAYTHENYTGGEAFNSLEAVLATSFSIFRYDFPETDITGAVSLLPSLTKSGRYRSDADLRAKYEFVDDLYFELRLYGSYDSQPPSKDTEKGDYGFVTSLGYSF